MDQAKWLSLQWKMTPDALRLLRTSGISKALQKDEEDTLNGQNPTHTKGFEPQELSLDYFVGLMVGTDPMLEWEAVQKHLGKRGTLYIAGKRFGPQILMLTGATFAASDITLDGRISAATISLTFSEDGGKADKAPAAVNESYVGEHGKGSAVKSGEKTTSAYDVRPSDADIADALGG